MDPEGAETLTEAFTRRALLTEQQQQHLLLQHLLPAAHFEQVAGEVHLVQIIMHPAQSLTDQQLHRRTH